MRRGRVGLRRGKLLRRLLRRLLRLLLEPRA
jgi:hypothetical protein